MGRLWGFYGSEDISIGSPKRLIRGVESEEIRVEGERVGSISAGCSKRPFSKAAGESKPEAYPQGYVEDFDEPRTKLADFFSTLLREGQ